VPAPGDLLKRGATIGAPTVQTTKNNLEAVTDPVAEAPGFVHDCLHRLKDGFEDLHGWIFILLYSYACDV
jgi:hypothetical protein